MHMSVSASLLDIDHLTPAQYQALCVDLQTNAGDYPTCPLARAMYLIDLAPRALRQYSCGREFKFYRCPEGDAWRVGQHCGNTACFDCAEGAGDRHYETWKPLDHRIRVEFDVLTCVEFLHPEGATTADVREVGRFMRSLTEHNFYQTGKSRGRRVVSQILYCGPVMESERGTLRSKFPQARIDIRTVPSSQFLTELRWLTSPELNSSPRRLAELERMFISVHKFVVRGYLKRDIPVVVCRKPITEMSVEGAQDATEDAPKRPHSHPFTPKCPKCGRLAIEVSQTFTRGSPLIAPRYKLIT